LTVNVLDCNNN